MTFCKPCKHGVFAGLAKYGGAEPHTGRSSAQRTPDCGSAEPDRPKGGSIYRRLSDGFAYPIIPCYLFSQ
ncbi:MAG: hypothetical protein LBI28_10280 [Treponema sp.]|nr:hypothetical protein [Treponema sp.]